MGLPLQDLRVIDLTVARAGPTCVRQLADWGADVIRIDPPSRPRVEPTESASGGENKASATASGRVGEAFLGSDYQNLHRNKRSLCLDLKTEAGRSVLYRLVDGADILVENMRPTVKYRLGFDFETLHARNPRLIYGSISGFGQDGPYHERGGVDQIAQGMGGLMSVTGMPGTEPTRVGIPVSDLSAGLYLSVGILAALHERHRTGVGRWVTTSLLESMIAMMDLQAVRYTVEGTVPVQEGNHHPTLVPMGCFASSDGYVNIAGPAGRLLHRFCEVIGMPELPQDPRFRSVGGRSRNRAALNAIVAERLRTRTTAEWVEALNAAGVPCGPVYRVDQVFADPQVEHLGMAAEIEHPALGKTRVLRNAVNISGSDPTVRSPSPAPGQHSEAILREIGLSTDEIEQLEKAGVL